MSNPNLSQAQMNNYFRRVAFAVRGFVAAREQTNRFRRSVVRTIERNDFNANFASPPVLSGVRLFYAGGGGGNTSDAGEVIWRVVANGGNWDINGYKKTGGSSGDKVCTATNVAAGATATFTASNSSGLTGSVPLAGSVTAETDDKHRTLVYPDWPLQAADAFDSTDSLDAPSIAAINTMMANQISNAVSVENAWLSLLGQILTLQVNKQLGFSVPGGAAITVTATPDQGTGAISLYVTGNIEELRNAMAANTTPQTVLRVAPAAGSPAYSSTGGGASVGQGVLAIATLFDHVKAGTLTGICTDQTVGAEKFTFTLTPTDLTTVKQDAQVLQVGGVFKSQSLGIASMTLSRTFAKTGDGSDHNLAAATDASMAVAGLNSLNSSSGTFGWKVSANGSNFDFVFYRTTSGFLDGDRVAQATNVPAATLFQATALNRSGITINWKSGSAPVATTTGTLACQCFQSGPPADRIDVAITNAMTGWQKWWGEMENWYLNGATSNPTIPDWITPASGAFATLST